MDLNEKHFRENMPYGVVFDRKNNKAEFFNRHYQPLGEITKIISIYDLKLRVVDLSLLTDEKIHSIFQTTSPDKDFIMGFFYTDNTNPYNQSNSNDHIRYLRIYEKRLFEFKQLISFTY